MCSILAILDFEGDPGRMRSRALELSRLQRHRGPDWSGVYAGERAILAHERLAIVDVTHGAQPLGDFAGGPVLAVNGEIYNHRVLRDRAPGYVYRTESDCEVILALYERSGVDFIADLNGIFAFVLHDPARRRFVVARDPIGVVPLYTGRDEDGVLHVASELKALTPVCAHVEEFPPGHVWDSEASGPVPFFDPAWRHQVPSGAAGDAAAAKEAVRGALADAVHRQLMSDVPYGVLLSGGLDSSIVAALASSFASRRVEDEDRSAAWWPRLHSFAIGLPGAPDLEAAREVARHLDTVHHEFHFTLQEGLDALRDVIYHIETYDVTTVRASVPMYLLARRIRAMGIKMVLSGEGADEIFGGYLYFHHAPDRVAFHEETVRKIDRLHSYDCLRANKSMAAWGVEARVPFLDLDFLDVAMGLDPEHKMVGPDGVEKKILRDAFADLLPAVVLDRQKEQFSDGVGYAWIDALKERAVGVVSDRQMSQAAGRFPHAPPATKEAYMYRAVFEEHFPLRSAVECVPGGETVACSTPEALAWSEALQGVNDPSGRAVHGVHLDAYGHTE